MQQPMTTFTVHLARSGECQQVAAQDWRSALKATSRTDACWLEPQGDGAIDATFDPEAPTMITTRCRQGTAAERLAFALACVANQLDAEANGRGDTA
ncbi:hypothetical protein ACGTN6_15020 [Halomonas sp. THAF12]|uniref:hypothetical protein n=1 Tax=Halomonas sp. B23F22_10 TaxID=3459515 RepID=UPI00373DEFF2